jgi:Zn finger protein HypA/HybF involved in hydrogenase expression
MENALMRTSRCAECGLEMLWTQNAWKTGNMGQAAYRCENGHVVDPALTAQCPACGVHDTELLGERDGRGQFRCARCSQTFEYPR